MVRWSSFPTGSHSGRFDRERALILPPGTPVSARCEWWFMLLACFFPTVPYVFPRARRLLFSKGPLAFYRGGGAFSPGPGDGNDLKTKSDLREVLQLTALPSSRR